MYAEHQKVEPWRALPVQTRLEFIRDVVDGITARQSVGHNEHGDTFVGEPLQHAWEEQMDAAFYIWVAARRQGIRLTGVLG
jgi:hypothetical protein